MNSLWIDLHDFSVIWMTAVIWLVQILIYPTFRTIPDSEFVLFHKRHCDRISIFVAPMLIQPFATLMILIHQPNQTEWMIHSACVVLIYAATAFLSVPEHHRLGKEKSIQSIERLVKGNWVRTLLWTTQLTLILIRRMANP
jgi:hypothetical protein